MDHLSSNITSSSTTLPHTDMSNPNPDPALIADDDTAVRDIEKGKDESIADPKLSTEKDNMKDPNIVEWDGPDDPQNPMNWPFWKKATFTAALSGLTFVVTFASSVFSTATQATAELYGVSTEVAVLGTSLFVLVCLAFLVLSTLPMLTTAGIRNWSFDLGPG